MIDESVFVFRNYRYSGTDSFVQVFAMTFVIARIKILFHDRKTPSQCVKLHRGMRRFFRRNRQNCDCICRKEEFTIAWRTIELTTDAYRWNGESQNWLPGYRGCQWKVSDGYERTISSVNARSLLIRRYYFSTSPRSSLKRKKRMKERVNAPGTYASSSHGWKRADSPLFWSYRNSALGKKKENANEEGKELSRTHFQKDFALCIKTISDQKVGDVFKFIVTL